MSDKRVYLDLYYRVADAPTLTVIVDGKSVPMDEFVQTHDPVQVTSLAEETERKGTLVGLIIAEEKPPQQSATWPKKG